MATTTAPDFKAFFARFRSLLALGLMVLALSLLSDRFLTPDNGWNILRQISVNLCLSIGMTLVIVTHDPGVAACAAVSRATSCRAKGSSVWSRM